MGTVGGNQLENVPQVHARSRWRVCWASSLPAPRFDGIGTATEEWLITASAHAVRIWEAATARLRHTLVTRQCQRIQAVAAIPTLVAVAINHERSRCVHQRGEVRVYALDTGELMTTAPLSGALHGCRWTEGGLYVHGSAGLYAFDWIT